MMHSQNRVAITTLGCKTNQFESAALVESLQKDGFTVVPFAEAADVYVINTCTVTARTDAESRKLIRRAKRHNPDARVIVTGCYAQVAPEQLAAMAEVELVIGNEEKKRLPELLRWGGTGERIQVADIQERTVADTLSLESFAEHTRAFLQVQNGCDSYCSYCIVPFARGRSRSVPPDWVLTGVERFVREGFREIVLTGIHLGNYGRDLAPSTSLLELLRLITLGPGTGRLRLGSLEPLDLTADLLGHVAGSGMICPHLHIPLQSGSDTVLARMNRGYDSRFFRELIERIASKVPGISLGCDVIAGFPGETDEEFAATCSLIDDLPLAYLHVFPYSSRPGTRAAGMPGHVPGRVIAERSSMLRELGERKKRVYQASCIGSVQETLVMKTDRPGHWSGMTGHYLTVGFSGGDGLANRLVNVRITGETADGLQGELLP